MALINTKGMMQSLGYGEFYSQGFRVAGGLSNDLNLDGIHVILTVTNKTKNLKWRGTGLELNADVAAFLAAIAVDSGNVIDIQAVGSTGGSVFSFQGFANGEWRVILACSGNGVMQVVDAISTSVA